ncbi:MAG TPA: Uma2 family endonuclease [Candidatus Binatia bacterium]|jgi:Uma2 family endonuclease|nr:Uma2 family endonuclease [Candidatus Binatia bacterium]
MQTEQLVIRHHLLTVADYHRMGEAGILGEDDRVELIDGELIEMAPIGSNHAGEVIRLVALLSSVLAGRALISPQNPVRLGDYSEPQPDITVLRFRDDFYRVSHPQPEDVLLLIEVADTTVRYDREIKIPLYARHGIPEVWLIDLQQERVEIYLQPGSEGYRQILRPGKSERIALSLLPDVSILITDLWSR